jgi:hypothetical protein
MQSFGLCIQFIYRYRFFMMVAPKRSAITNSDMKMKNRILAMDAAPAAIPPNPNKAAMIAMMKKMTAYRNIVVLN